MKLRITCASIFLLLQQILAIKEVYIENLPSEKSIDSSFSPSSTLESRSDELNPCPPGQSLHAKDEVKVMIDNVAETLSIYQSINDSYISQAIAVRDKHIDDCKLSKRNWFQNHPEHLKHIIEDLVDKRLYIEPMVTKLSLVLAEYYHLEQNIVKRVDKANSLVENFILYKIECENKCVVKRFDGISTKNEQDAYICGSLEDLQSDISSELKLFEIKMGTILQDKLTNDDRVFSDKIININKKNLKTRKEFDKIVYDILYLQDEYYHFIKDITRINPLSYIFDIKKIIIQIDLKLDELQNLTLKYINCCRKCKEHDIRVISQNTGVLSEHMESENTDILNDLLTEKLTNIESSINNDYANIFQELNTLLNNTDTVTEEVSFQDLKSIQNEIKEMLQVERLKFNELKKCVPQSQIEKLNMLLESSLKLLTNVTEEVYNVKRELLKHIHH